MWCRACGSENIVYDPNPRGLEVIHTCLFGSPVTGEPGACRCGNCGSLDIDEAEEDEELRGVDEPHFVIADDGEQ